MKVHFWKEFNVILNQINLWKNVVWVVLEIGENRLFWARWIDGKKQENLVYHWMLKGICCKKTFLFFSGNAYHSNHTSGTDTQKLSTYVTLEICETMEAFYHDSNQQNWEYQGQIFHFGLWWILAVSFKRMILNSQLMTSGMRYSRLIVCFIDFNLTQTQTPWIKVFLFSIFRLRFPTKQTNKLHIPEKKSAAKATVQNSVVDKFISLAPEATSWRVLHHHGEKTRVWHFTILAMQIGFWNNIINIYIYVDNI